MPRHLALAALIPLLAAGGCMTDLSGSVQSEGEQDVSGTQYVNLADFSKIDQGQWFDAVAKLNTELGAVCGDTFCEGDYANLTPLSFGCSVSSKAGVVHDCAWTFAAAQLEVDGTSAAIQTDAPTFQCHITAKTTAVALSQLLASSADALHAPLPGAASIYDQLGDCFQHPIGATPLPPVTGTTYVAASDYYLAAPSRAKWTAAQAALLAGFDNICGDTFCGSDFGDLQSLVFDCAITKSSGNVKSCAWVFGGSFHTVAAAGGALQETSRTFRCPVAVKGTLPQLIGVLTAAGTQPAIDRPLPGMTTSAYDALGGCLP